MANDPSPRRPSQHTHKRIATAQKKFDNGKADPETKDQKDTLGKDLQMAKTTLVNAQKNLLKIVKLFFSLCKTLLGKNDQVKWTRIVATQAGAAPWTVFQGNVQSTA